MPSYTVYGASCFSPAAQNSDEAQTAYFGAVEIAQRQTAKSLELHAVRSLARLYHKRGKPREARGILAQVYDRFSEGFDTMDLVKRRRYSMSYRD